MWSSKEEFSTRPTKQLNKVALGALDIIYQQSHFELSQIQEWK
jgi:hypothetical protein